MTNASVLSKKKHLDKGAHPYFSTTASLKEGNNSTKTAINFSTESLIGDKLRIISMFNVNIAVKYFLYFQRYSLQANFINIAFLFCIG